MLVIFNHMAHRLPLFPLDVVLFPGTPLPLHIFEPRYRTMLADCLEGDQRFGIVPIAIDGALPKPGTIGCTAHIRGTQLLPDGRSNIVVVGESRFVVKHYLDESLPYALAMVADFDDDDGGEVAAEQVSQLQRLSQEYLTTLHRLNDTPAPEMEFPEDVASFSFQVSAALELDAEFKQRLLVTRSTAERVRLLLKLLPPLLTDLQGRANVHEHARTNGKSHGRFQPEEPA
jgi:Lon protease-like protein